MTDGVVRAHFRDQAAACRRLGSPFTADLLTVAADRLTETDPVAAHVLGWPGDPADDALALRFAAALHALVLTQRDAGLVAVYPPAGAGGTDHVWAAVEAALDTHADHVRDWLTQPPQTNEVGRAGMLLPGLLAAARRARCPVEILEVGSSAGLNLRLDRFAYRYGTARWGPENAPVVLAPDLGGAVPDLSGALEIIARRGVDIAPVDPADPADRLRLMAYVWADQTARLERLEAALGIAAAAPERVERQDAAEAVAGFAKPVVGRLKLVVHTIMWQYLPAETRDRIDRAIAAAGETARHDAPFGRLSMEPGGPGRADLRLRLWPDGFDIVLAHCDFHGRWIDWLSD